MSSVRLLDKTRKIGKLLHNNNSVSYTHLGQISASGSGQSCSSRGFVFG